MISLPCKILSLRRNRTIQIRPSFETNQTAVDSKDLSHCKKGHLQEDRKKQFYTEEGLKTQATHRPKSKFDMRKLNHTFSFKPVANRGAPQGYSTSLAPWKSSIYVQITLLLNVEFVNSLHWWLASHSVSFYNLSVSGITVPTTGTSTYWPSSSTTKLTNPTTKKLTSRRLPNSKGTISVTKGESDEASHIFRDN